MKGKEVPALRSKRGLHRGSGAEPQVVGLAPRTTQEKKADTMKTYLLKKPTTVEPEGGQRGPGCAKHSGNRQQRERAVEKRRRSRDIVSRSLLKNLLSNCLGIIINTGPSTLSLASPKRDWQTPPCTRVASGEIEDLHPL